MILTLSVKHQRYQIYFSTTLLFLYRSGLLFCLVVLVTTSTVMGCIETLSSCVVDEWPSMKTYKPAISFTFLAFIFMTNLVMATQGGIYIYYLLTSYYTSWPLIFFGLLTTLAAVFSHGGKYLMKDLSDMSKMPLTHYINSHLSVLYVTIIPVFLTVRCLFSLCVVIHCYRQQPTSKNKRKYDLFYGQNCSILKGLSDFERTSSSIQMFITFASLNL